MNAAQSRLQGLVPEIRNQSPKTLAYWRLANPDMIQALESFAASHSADGPSSSSLLQETQALFDTINPILARQEADSPEFLQQRRRRCKPLSFSPPNTSATIAVVLGGKYSDSPRSISELLVAKLAATCSKVFTVSRSSLDPSMLPSNVTHIAKQHLDAPADEGGADEMKQVLQLATEEWGKIASSNSDNKTEFVLYITLGQHKGENPFTRNLQAAHNLAQTLLDTTTFAIPALNNSKACSWKVVLTGTAATLPSTYPDGTISLEIDNEGVTDLIIPTYKIMKYNYTYAMSKLGQYYIVARAIAQRTGKDTLAITWQSVIEKMERHVRTAGEDADYHPETAIVGMEELDAISAQVPLLVTSFPEEYLRIAEGISICYTPLHARPWTEQAVKASATDRQEQKAYVLEQIVKRFKNAVSIEHAVASHLLR